MGRTEGLRDFSILVLSPGEQSLDKEMLPRTASLASLSMLECCQRQRQLRHNQNGHFDEVTDLFP